MPAGGSISKIMQVYKRAVSFNIGNGSIWQSRFHIKIVEKLKPFIRYIHQNPVKEDLCESPEKYPWSSASEKWEIDEIDLM